MENENKVYHYEDVIGNFLVKLSSHNLDDSESIKVARLLKVIGDLERISDHSINIVKSAEEINTVGDSPQRSIPCTRNRYFIHCKKIDLKVLKDVSPPLRSSVDNTLSTL